MPEQFEGSTRAFRSACGVPVRKDHCIHRTGGGTGNAVDPEPWFLEEPVEHAPGEGAMRTAALERKVDQKCIANGISGSLRGVQLHLSSCTKYDVHRSAASCTLSLQ